MKTTEKERERRRTLSLIFREGNRRVNELIFIAENPIFSYFIEQKYNSYLEWSYILTPRLRKYFDDLLEDVSVSGFIKYTRPRFRMPDGKLYSIEEIKCYSLLN